MKAELGEDHFRIYQELLRIKRMTNTAQARLPFEILIH